MVACDGGLCAVCREVLEQGQEGEGAGCGGGRE